MTDKAHTPAQLANADRMAEFLSRLPEEKRSLTIMAANAFIAGMEAQAQLAAQAAQPSA